MVDRPGLLVHIVHVGANLFAFALDVFLLLLLVLFVGLGKSDTALGGEGPEEPVRLYGEAFQDFFCRWCCWRRRHVLACLLTV